MECTLLLLLLETIFKCRIKSDIKYYLNRHVIPLNLTVRFTNLCKSVALDLTYMSI